MKNLIKKGLRFLIRFLRDLPQNSQLAHRKFMLWRYKRLSDRQFLILVSILVGFTSGMAAVFLKNMVHWIQELLKADFVHSYENVLYLIYPGIGIFLTVLLIKYGLKRRVGHGIPSTLFAISKKSSKMPKSSTFASLISSMLTVGFGGSVGLEGPTVGASSAIGSNYARLGRMNYKTTTLMLGCGAAGAMSGIFNAPIAAIVFALEVIMLDLTATSLIPLLMASVSAALTSSFMLGDDVLFDVDVVENFTFGDLPFYILLGAFTGLISVYFCKVYWFIESLFEKVKGQFRKALIGALILGFLIFLFPPLYGEGFATINHLLGEQINAILEGSYFYELRENVFVLIGFLIAIVLLKAVATTVTLGAGGIGGVFAPSLFIGSVTGFVFAKLINLLELVSLSERNFTLVGMGGVMAGILHAPLTALFLIAEITGGYELVIPLMITAAIAFLTSKYYNPHSLYTMQLAKRGELITHDKDKAVLTLMRLGNEIEKDFALVYPTDTLGQLVEVVSRSRRNIFPVINEEAELQGIVKLDDIRQIMFEPNLYKEVKVADVMSDFEEQVSPEESMDSVMKKFNESGAWNLPVIREGKYVGFVSKSKLFNAYRKVLQDFSQE